MSDKPGIGYYWGDDDYGLESAAAALAVRVAGGPGAPPLARWRMAGAATKPAEIAERVATATLFGGGTIVVVEDAGPLIRGKADRDALYATLAAVAPGNALAFLEPSKELKSERRPAGLRALEQAVHDAGGEVRMCVAPREGAMANWIMERARERRIGMEPAAAQLLARRIGAFVREGDVDRRRQGQLAVLELEKLALYRLDQPIRPADVEALVVDAIPGSTWGFMDAVADRRLPEAAAQLERVLDATAEPLLLAMLHRRVRELIGFADAQARRDDLAAAGRALKVTGFPAQIRARQASAWTPQELDAALDGLLELDAALKGEGTGDPRRRRLAFALWLATHVGRG